MKGSASKTYSVYVVANIVVNTEGVNTEVGSGNTRNIICCFTYFSLTPIVLNTIYYYAVVVSVKTSPYSLVGMAIDVVSRIGIRKVSTSSTHAHGCGATSTDSPPR